MMNGPGATRTHGLRFRNAQTVEEESAGPPETTQIDVVRAVPAHNPPTTPTTGFNGSADPHPLAKGSGWEVPRSYVYFVAAGSERLKIGTTRNLRNRLSELQTSNPEELALLSYVEGGRDLEKRLHALFAKDRLHGEWFQKSDDILELLEFLYLDVSIEIAIASVEETRTEVADCAQGELCLVGGPHTVSVPSPTEAR